MSQRPRTKFEQSIPDYRSRILLALAKAVLVPPLITLLVFYALRLPPNAIATLATTFSIPVAVVCKSHYAIWAEDRAAARHHARSIPRVVGKLPGNLDVVMRVLKDFQTGYVLQAFNDLFEEYNCTVLNTRFFWSDQVCDPALSLACKARSSIEISDHYHG